MVIGPSRLFGDGVCSAMCISSLRWALCSESARVCVRGSSIFGSVLAMKESLIWVALIAGAGCSGCVLGLF